MKADKEFVREAVAEIVCCDKELIKDDTDFLRELMVNSVQMLEIVASIEDEYDIEIKGNDFSKYNTLNSIMEALEEM